MSSKAYMCFVVWWVLLVVFNAFAAVGLASQDKPFTTQVVLSVLFSVIAVFYFFKSQEGK